MKEETRKLAFLLGSGFCMCSPNCLKDATDIHHKLPKTKTNKRLYPLFINSIFNLLPLNNGCHLNKPIPTIRPREAGIYEVWLRTNGGTCEESENASDKGAVCTKEKKLCGSKKNQAKNKKHKR